MPSPTDKKITVRTRLVAMLLDHGIMCFIAVLMVLPVMLYYVIRGRAGGNGMLFLMEEGPLSYVAAAAFALYLCKDCIKGRSLAKRIMGHQVVDNKTGQVATPLQCLVRNILIFIWPVEVIAVQINPARRLGDKLAGTKVVTYDPALEQPRVKPVKLVVPFIIAYCCILLTMLPYTQWVYKMKAPVYPQIQYDKASYNDRESFELKELYDDSAGKALAIIPSVYDKTAKPGIRYILINYYNIAVAVQDVSDSSVKAMITGCLYARYPKDSITGLARELRFGDDEELNSFPIGKVYPR